MKMKIAMVCTLSVLVSAVSLAAAPRLSTSKSIAIDAPASKVWQLAKDFNGLNNWHPAVAKDEIVEGQNNHAGAVRQLTLKDGGIIKERLLAFDGPGRTFKYAIVESVLPVSDYKSTFNVKSTGKNHSLVTWTGHFKRKNVGDNPGEKENDKAATDTIAAVYQGGLDNLKKLAETP